GRSGAEIGQAEIDVDGGGEEAVLAAVVAHHHGRVDLGVSGDSPDRRLAEALGGEPAAGSLQDRRAGGVRPARTLISGHANKCRPTNVDLPSAARSGDANNRWQTDVDRITAKEPSC